MAEQVGPPTQVAGYLLDGAIAEGAMATVYRARRADSGAPVALKVLASELARSPEHRRRFEREAGYARALGHPHVVRVFEVGNDDQTLYIAMQYVRGSDLCTLLAREGPLPAPRTVAMLAQVAGALDAAHATGLLHRDVKPGNILVASGDGPEPAGHCYLTDFGLGKNRRLDSAAVTAPGQFVGTWHYTAPELIAGEEFDHRVDVYSLGCVLYECLTAQPPFAGSRGTDVLKAHLSAKRPLVSAHRPELPDAVDAIVARALERDPQARPESCGALVQALADVVGRERPAGAEGLRLGVLAGGEPGRELVVQDELVIGRDEAGPGALSGDRELSRRHARIHHAGDGSFLIEDLGATNRTEVNGEPIASPATLALNDRIQLGGTILIVVALPEPAAGAGRLDLCLDLDAAGRATIAVAGQDERLVLQDGGWRRIGA